MENTPCFPGWKIVRRIGRGHFGAVYEIEKDDSGSFSTNVEHSAMKVISIPPSEDELESLQTEYGDDATISTLLRSQVDDITGEFELMSQLQGHSNIVSYHDHEIIQHNDKLGWDVLIRMELLTSLSAYTRSRTMEEGEIIRLGMDMCQALKLCERHNILHRDIKPQNIFVNKDGNFKLGDFGVARLSGNMTGSTVTGTYDYMAPEVHSHLFSKGSYDKRVDIYSLGLVLYWLLNEHRGPFLPLPPKAFSNDTRNKATQKRMDGEPLPQPVHGSRELQDIVLKACAFKPEDRYQSAEEFYNALGKLPGSEPIPAPQTPIPEEAVSEEEEVAESDENGSTVAAFARETVPAPKEEPDSAVKQPPKQRKKHLPLIIAAACAAAVLAAGVYGYFHCWFGHSWGEGALTTPATHVSTGEIVYTCSVCGETRKETVARLAAHTYDQEVADEKYLKSTATCTEPAMYYYSCECGEKGTEAFPHGEPNGHQWDNGVVTIAATHMSEGIKTYTCSVCGETDEEVVNRLTEHTYDQEIVDEKYLKAAATCTEPAVYYRSCICGEAGTETFPYGEVTEHIWGEGEVTVAATCTSTGEIAFTCSACRERRVDLIAKQAHTFDQKNVGVKYLKSAATCTEQAVYYYSCTCGEKGTETFSYGEPNGHSWGNGVVTTAATTSSTGTRTYRCSACGQTYKETIAKLAVASGICGDNLTWWLDDEGTLTISGTGEMTSYASDRIAPWYSNTIRKITIENGVTSIGDYAFRHCSSLTTITLPDSVTSIGNNAFSDCIGLTTITLPDSVTSIGNYAFSGCSGLTTITLPDSVTSIGNYAFFSCSGLTTITLPDSVTSIGNNAFSGCIGLTTITLPDSVTSIGNYAFYNCSSLTTITLPDSVTSIGNYAFSYCRSLEKVYYTGTQSERSKIGIKIGNACLTDAKWYYNS